MPKHIVSCAAKCPYYKAHERSEIYCKGLKDRTAIHIGFAIPTEKTDWMNSYCKSIDGFANCPVKEMLDCQE